jgi:plastocyanin
MGRRIITGALMISIALTVGIACSSSKDNDPTPVTQFKITPASGVPTAAASATPASQATAATASVQGTPASQPTAAASPASGTPASQATVAPQATATSGGGGSTISIAAVNILFDKTKLTASAGTVKIEFDNKDGGIPHNINVFDGKDASAKSLGATALEAGPVKQVLTLDLKAGSYFYQCDVHPTTMTGTLTVS